MMRLAYALIIACASPAAAAEPTLADLRTDLSTLKSGLQSLRGELLASGVAGFTAAGGDSAIDRMNAMEAGLLKPGEVTVNVSEEGWDQAPDVVGDGFRRRERQFGRLVDSVSEVMSADEPFRSNRVAHDYPGVSEKDRVVAEYSSLASVTASTSSGYVDNLAAIRPEMGPYAAVDGSEETFWRSAPLTDPTEQWLEFKFTDPEPLTELRLVAGVDLASGAPVRKASRAGPVWPR